MKRPKTKIDNETNNRVYKAAKHRVTAKCSICPPNKGCNTKSYKKYGETKPRKKDKR